MINSKLSVLALILLMLLGCASGNNDEDNGVSDAGGGTGEDLCGHVITDKNQDI